MEILRKPERQTASHLLHHNFFYHKGKEDSL